MSNEHNHQVNERTYQEVEYLKKNLGPILVAALAEICIRRPSDPIEYLGHWLLRWRYNEELKRKDVQNALEVVRDQQWTQGQHEAAKSNHAQPGKLSSVASVAASSIAGILGPRATEASTNAIVEQLIVGHLEGALANEPLRPGEGQYHMSQIIRHHGQHPHLSEHQQHHENGLKDIAVEPENEIFETEFNGPPANEFYTDEELQGLQTQAEGALESIKQTLQGSVAGSIHQVRKSIGAAPGEPRKTSVGQSPRLSTGQEPRLSMGQPPRASIGQPLNGEQPRLSSAGHESPKPSVGQPGQPPHVVGSHMSTTSTAARPPGEEPRKSSAAGQKKMSTAAKPSVNPKPAGSRTASEAALDEEEEEQTPSQIAAKYK